jgi:hypothetical protein
MGIVVLRPSSMSRSIGYVIVRIMNNLVGSALKGCSNNKKRHSIIENFLLSCDRDTVAVEVPVWYWDKKLGGVCGHIDILQVKNGRVWVMDFKPHASRENVDKVVSQLWLYARALSFRTGLGLDDFKCSWFDWNDEYVFSPSEVRLEIKDKEKETPNKEATKTSEGFEVLKSDKIILKGNTTKMSSGSSIETGKSTKEKKIKGFVEDETNVETRMKATNTSFGFRPKKVMFINPGKKEWIKGCFYR